jgi:NinB protein
VKGRTFQLTNLQQGLALVESQVKPMLASFLAAGMGLVLRVEEVSKTREQEAKYHAMIGDISEQAQHLGSKWDADDWKRLLIDKFARETNRTHGRIIPNLDSDGVVEVGILSRKFSRRDAVEFIEWLYAWGAENGCEFTEKFTDPESGEIIKTTWQQKVARREATC